MKQKKVWLILALNLLLIGVTLAWYVYTPPLSRTCAGNLTFSARHDDHDFSFEGEITLRFQPDNTGYLTLNGDVVNEPHHWDVSRQEMFTWRHVEGSLYEIFIQSVARFSHDTLPPGVFEKYVAGVERSLIESALQQSGGVQIRAAELLKVSYRSFRHLLKKYDI